MDDLVEARARSVAGDWSAAAELWGRVVEANPVHGTHWWRLAEARVASDDVAGALVAYERVAELGAWDGPATPFPAEVAHRIAQCRARLGDVDGAFDALRSALELGFRDLGVLATDPHLAALRRDERWPLPTARTRADDLDLFAREVKRRAFRHTSFDAEVGRLRQRVDHLSDAELLVELSRLVATLGDGHARVEPPADRADLHLAIPVRLDHFADGVFVTAAAPEHADLLGAEVLACDGVDLDLVLARVEEIVSRDNAYGALAGVMRKLPRTAVLHALGIAEHADRMTLRLRSADGSVAETTVPARPISKEQADARPCPPEWRFLLSPPLPLYLRNVAAPYWYVDQPDDDLLYVQINSVSDDPAEPFDAFVSGLFADLARRAPRRLVVDLRWNEGGNTFLTMPLLHRLIAYAGEIFVVIGRHTLSAAQNLSTLIAHHTPALFVGEPTGSSPNFVGETAPFELPHSRFQVNVSDLYWQTSWPMDHRTWLPPDIYTPPTFAAYARNQDPALDAIRAYPRQTRPSYATRTP
ncbi:Tetratricopeptide repeat-containing protein [Asanoa ishikariensis]|uniref:Tetratricopeptide repeat-containing protein n=1 Tax=Asanoa ishikariensis TaxID=137265 RepID=A0A1H3NXV5_9ACTN|nr:tetratricopeptide repeat protein [Asanoa ishikariensis]SDY93648.1 Tetratricopeptide repeat-containing protein [Asanoa ishikariensis]